MRMIGGMAVLLIVSWYQYSLDISPVGKDSHDGILGECFAGFPHVPFRVDDVLDSVYRKLAIGIDLEYVFHHFGLCFVNDELLIYDLVAESVSASVELPPDGVVGHPTLDFLCQINGIGLVYAIQD